jgi:hypothetical protein
LSNFLSMLARVPRHVVNCFVIIQLHLAEEPIHERLHEDG